MNLNTRNARLTDGHGFAGQRQMTEDKFLAANDLAITMTDGDWRWEWEVTPLDRLKAANPIVAKTSKDTQWRGVYLYRAARSANGKRIAGDQLFAAILDPHPFRPNITFRIPRALRGPLATSILRMRIIHIPLPTVSYMAALRLGWVGRVAYQAANRFWMALDGRRHVSPTS